jgi:aminoglycoside phosphotransferase (APT) family kinase protein
VDEAAFLAQRAAASGITTDDAIAAVTDVTGAAPRTVEQFAGGYAAVPFWATLADGRDAVVRIAMRDDATYLRERDVIRHMAAGGIPVPEVIGVTSVRGHQVSVLSRLDGRPLLELMHERGADDPLVRQRCREAGEVLRAMHAVDPHGLTLPEETLFYREVEPFLRAYPRPRDLAVVRAAIDACLTRYPRDRSSVIHRDFGPDHVLVDEHGITGIIDWERAFFGDPAVDVAWWPTHFTLAGVTLGTGDDVRVGYGLHPEVNFDDRVHFWHRVQCVNAAAYAWSCGMDDTVITPYIDALRRALGRTAALGPSLD